MDPNEAPKRLGVYVQPGLGQAYPDLAKAVRAILVDRVAKLPFLPAGWLADVLDLVDTSPITLVKIYPVLRQDGGPMPEAPAFLINNPAAAKIWQDLSEVTRLAQFNYAAGKVAEGRAIMAEAEADAAFWNSAIMRTASAVQETLIATPGRISNAAGTFLSDLTGPFLRKAWWVIALVILGYVVWVNRNSLAKAAPGVAKRAARKVAAAAAGES